MSLTSHPPFGMNGFYAPFYKIVYQYSKDGVFIREWESVKVAQESLGCFSISPVALGKRKYKTSGGFIWKYIKN